MTRAKVCGITTVADLGMAVDAGVDAVGLLSDVNVDSPREISPEKAAEFAATVPPFVTSVLVTTPDTPERAVELTRQVEPEIVQFHGDMTPGDVAYVSSSVAAEVMRVVKADDPEMAHANDDVADAILLDTPSEHGGGGTGRTHDWDRASELADELESPVVLAGGLNPDNVGRAVEVVDPYAVDVASGVEREPGRKDPDAVESFVANAKPDSSRVRPSP